MTVAICVFIYRVCHLIQLIILYHFYHLRLNHKYEVFPVNLTTGAAGHVV